MPATQSKEINNELRVNFKSVLNQNQKQVKANANLSKRLL